MRIQSQPHFAGMVVECEAKLTTNQGAFLTTPKIGSKVILGNYKKKNPENFTDGLVYVVVNDKQGGKKVYELESNNAAVACATQFLFANDTKVQHDPHDSATMLGLFLMSLHRLGVSREDFLKLKPAKTIASGHRDFFNESIAKIVGQEGILAPKLEGLWLQQIKKINSDPIKALYGKKAGKKYRRNADKKTYITTPFLQGTAYIWDANHSIINDQRKFPDFNKIVEIDEALDKVPDDPSQVIKLADL